MTKEEISSLINSIHFDNDKKKSGVIRKEVEVKIPIYQSKMRKLFLLILVFLFQKKAYLSDEEPKQSIIDFSKCLDIIKR